MKIPATTAGKALALVMFAALAANGPAQNSTAATDDPPTFSKAERKRIARHVRVDLKPDTTNRFADDPAAAHLGRFLFYETRLSSDNTMSCATCHDPSKGFADGRTLAEGRTTLKRHTMTLWNAAHHRWLFWDGRADSLWGQALAPIENPDELAGSRTSIARLIYTDPELGTAYECTFGALPEIDHSKLPPSARPHPANPEHAEHIAWLAMSEVERDAVAQVFVNVGKAIAAYERQLVVAETPFDRFARSLAAGQVDDSYPSSAQRGLKMFVGEANCVLCHTGPAFSDGEFHATSIAPLPGTGIDSGRYDGIPALDSGEFTAASMHSDDREGPAARKLTGLIRGHEVWGQFRTPGLRNISLSPPYMHQGQLGSLREVLEFYSTREGAIQIGHHQESVLVPLNLSDEQLGDLEAFLLSLTADPSESALLGPPGSPIPPSCEGEG